MESTESESRQASGEARRDVLSRGSHPSAGAHYDAVLRYLRGLYVRAPKASVTPPKQTSAEPETEGTAAAGPKSEPSGSADTTRRQAEPGT